jgi:Fe-S-cluster-containing dehydrogenase component/DMSO reductase anchor subunit
MPTSFVFDTNKCTGCQACRLACTIENGLDLDRSWRSVFTFNARRDPAAPVFHLSLACNHCADPACMGACPALAYSKDPRTGVVLLDSGKCIGCNYCAWACPYDAPDWDATAGVMSKCTFCNDRLAQGLAPACAIACPTGALKVADLGTGAVSNHVEGFPQTDMGPSIDILPLREGGRAPEASGAAPIRPATPNGRPLSSGISLRSEWSLMTFSLLAALLFGMLAAAVVADRSVSPLQFSGLGLFAMALSAAHLGRKLRAWRAILNVASSWLSREILGFTLFVGIGTLYLTALAGSVPGAGFLRDEQVGGLGWVALTFSLLTLISIDRVYDFAIRPVPGLPHSAGALLTGLFFAGLLAESPVLAGVVGGLKLGLYVSRKSILLRQKAGAMRHLAGVLRVGVGLLLPAVAWLTLAGDGRTSTLILLAALIGETIDRAEFYDELEILTPARQMATDLSARVASGTVSTGSRLP